MYNGFAKSPEIKKDVKALIYPNLKCPENPLCDQENAKVKKIYDFIGEKVVFTAEEAEFTCQSIEGACDR